MGALQLTKVKAVLGRHAGPLLLLCLPEAGEQLRLSLQALLALLQDLDLLKEAAAQDEGAR